MPTNRLAYTKTPASQPASGGVAYKANPSNYGNATTKVINLNNNNWLGDSVVFTVDSAWRYVVHVRNSHNGASSIHIDDVRVYGMNTATYLACDTASGGYRYGFNGQERDDEVYGPGNSYTAEFWQYDARLGRRWNVDPMASKYAWQSPYVAFDNNPINIIDPKGLEGKDPKQDKVQKGEGPSAFAKRNNMSLNDLAKNNTDVFKNYDKYEDKSEYWKNADKNYMLHPDQLLNVTAPGGEPSGSAGSGFTFNLGFGNPITGTTGGVNTLGLTTFGIGTIGSTLQYTPGSFRLGTTKLGFSPKYYGNAWPGNQFATTYNISRIGKGLGYIGFGVGTVVDGVGVWNYYNNPASSYTTHPGKAGLNLGFGLLGLFGGPYGATVSGGYFLGETVHPQGWQGLLKDGAETQKEYDRIWKSGSHPNNPLYRPEVIPWGADKY